MIDEEVTVITFVLTADVAGSPPVSLLTLPGPGPGPDCLVLTGPDHSQSQVDPINDCTGVHKPWLYRQEQSGIKTQHWVKELYCGLAVICWFDYRNWKKTLTIVSSFILIIWFPSDTYYLCLVTHKILHWTVYRYNVVRYTLGVYLPCHYWCKGSSRNYLERNCLQDAIGRSRENPQFPSGPDS